MILEMRTTTLKPRTTPKFLESYAALRGGSRHAERVKAAWTTIAGPLNQFIELVSYDSHAERAAMGSAPDTHDYHPDLCKFIDDQDSKIVIPASFSPPLEAETSAGLYEIRFYTYAAGTMAGVVEAWSNDIAPRAKLSRLVMAGYTDIGPLNEWIHIWTYKDSTEREQIRKAATDAGIWPPKPVPIRQRNVFMEAVVLDRDPSRGRK